MACAMIWLPICGIEGLVAASFVVDAVLVLVLVAKVAVGFLVSLPATAASKSPSTNCCSRMVFSPTAVVEAGFAGSDVVVPCPGLPTVIDAAVCWAAGAGWVPDVAVAVLEPAARMSDCSL